MKLPEHTRRYVIWGKDGGSRLVYLVGYCPDSLEYFQAMFNDAKQVVPDINAAETICGKVQKSRSCQGFTLMLIAIHGSKRDIPGFKSATWEELDIEAF